MMKSTLLALICCSSIVVANSFSTLAQSCRDGQCQLAPPSTIVMPQDAASDGIDTRAVARVVNELQACRALGSGTLIGSAEGRGLVVTCAHLFRDGTGRLSVSFPRRQSLAARLLKVDETADLAALEISDPGIPPAMISETIARPGDALVSCGFGSDGRLWCNRGRALGYVTLVGAARAETLELSGSARMGDSGGPVLDTQGRLVAVLFGTNGQVVDGTYCGRVKRFLGELMPRFCQRPANLPLPSVEPPIPTPSVTPPPDSVAAPPLEPAQLSELKRLVAAIERGWNAISAKLDRVVIAFQQASESKDDKPAPDLTPPLVELPPGMDKIGDEADSLANAAGPWVVARLTALLVSFGIPGGIAGAAAGGVVYLVMRRGRARAQAELERWRQSASQSAGEAPSADGSPVAVVERHHNRYVPYEISELDKAWASAHAHVGEKYPGAIPYLKMVESVKDQLLSGQQDSQTS